MAEAMTEIAQVPPEELFGCIPFLEPPKVAADLVEALCGAVFLDARCDLDTVFAVCDRIFAPLIPLLTAAGPPVDPISALRQACDKRRCREVVNACVAVSLA
jgi:dsRNA-specific ribonuclease